MKIKYDTCLEPDLDMNATEEINAKKLLMLFLDEHAPLDRTFEMEDELKTFYAALDKMEGDEYMKSVKSSVEAFPWMVCRCVYEFIAQCPHIHITID